MVYTGNMNFVGLAGVMSMEILIYAYGNVLQILRKFVVCVFMIKFQLFNSQNITYF